MTAEGYLASIDWIGAVAVGAVLVVIGLVLLRFLMASSSEVGSMLPGAGSSAARRLLDASRDLPPDSWVCATCHSVNRPTATMCYRGCGRREELAQPLPEDPNVVGSGANGRRS